MRIEIVVRGPALSGKSQLIEVLRAQLRQLRRELPNFPKPDVEIRFREEATRRGGRRA